ncbi:MAG TPA: glycine cleavage system protein GcvH [Myxococcaceae bacterium]|jgi:glycine cleavage system H protein|nr:glycine cleavage system protein GcvH [Myxococcaceae bacterium]
MSENPKDLKYTKDHEWARPGKTIVIGVTHYAQESLGDVVYVELPKVGTTLSQGHSFGVIESTKAVSELYAPVNGKVVKVNEELTNAPQTVNQDPYGKGWMIEVEPSEPKQLDGLLDAAAYEQLVASTK